MSDDLVKRLTNPTVPYDPEVCAQGFWEDLCGEAKARIEALTAQLQAMKEAHDDVEQYARRHCAEVEALTAERDEYKRSATHSEDVVRAARAEIDQLRALLAEADCRIVWEGHGLGSDFTERVEAALKGQQP